ncbi:carbon-nitrogen family hydrolase [Modestobacter sp. VKM Ac-2979]|uniref:nitrilase-related carbon-nitrogen hydrolase n=1 Tax=unclassified Modestobacter TaxID=2643866 RepID=UPI0022ABBA35|nr:MULTISPECIES: nitrilase-related carbon-nitrogen hydrolase [unclassified Modestobacter]MCZ2814178.1 carbon-nitrogen family hydrolase [Modestobacter sp. VKM Ac-2979]MCZ2844406.1 carbon-nitrogen family hydrolase [Modestobacter sp. VKM Ac-2980]
MKIAAVQHDIVWEDRDANFARLAPQVARAVGAGAELVLLTETFSTGFSMTPGIGEPEGGPSSEFLAAQAAEHGVWVAGTCPETDVEGELPYNTFVLAGPDGTTHRYRKLHPFADERTRFRSGTGPVTVEVGGLRITPFICYDLRFADVFWAAAAETDVYLVPANWPSPRRHHWSALLQARAIENQAYVVGCNRVGTAGDGTEHAGDSRVISPMGELLATASGVETIVLADVDAAEVTATRDRFRFIADRRS